MSQSSLITPELLKLHLEAQSEVLMMEFEQGNNKYAHLIRIRYNIVRYKHEKPWGQWEVVYQNEGFTIDRSAALWTLRYGGLIR